MCSDGEDCGGGFDVTTLGSSSDHRLQPGDYGALIANAVFVAAALAAYHLVQWAWS